MDNKVRSAAEVITRLFDSLERENFEQADRFVKSWSAIVGDRIAAHSKVLDVNRGTVVVEVDHPGWSQQLQFIKKKVIKTLALQFPELNITTMTMRVSSVCTTPYQRQEGSIGEGLPRQDAPEEQSVPVDSQLDDPLKDVLSRLRDSIQKGKPR